MSIVDIYDPRLHINQGTNRRGKYAAEIYVEDIDRRTVSYILPYGRKFWREDILADC